VVVDGGVRMKATGFDTHVAERLEMGAREYGDRSYSRPLPDLLGEMTEECADIAAWGLIALAAHPDDAEAAPAIRCAESHARRAWQQLRSVIPEDLEP
jgi:hypothetical protein